MRNADLKKTNVLICLKLHISNVRNGLHNESQVRKHYCFQQPIGRILEDDDKTVNLDSINLVTRF